jgi:hypothetical protein
MICAYLLFVEACATANEALIMYGTRRSKNHKGLTIPSQIRYIFYFEQFLKERLVERYMQKVSMMVKNSSVIRRLRLDSTRTLELLAINIGPVKKSWCKNATIIISKLHKLDETKVFN